MAREPSEKDLLRRIGKVADRIDAATEVSAGLYEERLALFRAARALPVPVKYDAIAAAARCSQAAVFKCEREARKANR